MVRAPPCPPWRVDARAVVPYVRHPCRSAAQHADGHRQRQEQSARDYQAALDTLCGDTGAEPEASGGGGAAPAAEGTPQAPVLVPTILVPTVAVRFPPASPPGVCASRARQTNLHSL